MTLYILILFIYIDTIEEVKTTCQFCNKKAVLNLKHVNGFADVEGPVVQMGAEEKYFPTCFGCYRSSLIESGQCPTFWTEDMEETERFKELEDRATPVVH